jgi:ribosomal protein S6--L-glutamate ligase
MKVIKRDDDVRSGIEEFMKSGHEILYIQKVIDIPEKDFGLVFIGGEYVATYARVKNRSSWNTCINSGGKYQPFEPSEDMIELARKAQSIFGLDFTCVDIAQTKDELYVFEVSAFGGFRGLKDAYGIDAASMYLDHVLKELERNE